MESAQMCRLLVLLGALVCFNFFIRQSADVSFSIVLVVGGWHFIGEFNWSSTEANKVLVVVFAVFATMQIMFTISLWCVFMGFASGENGDSVVVANALVWSFTFVACVVACLAGIGHRVSDIANTFIQSFATGESTQPPQRASAQPPIFVP
jgi:hypothetical protein